MRKGVKSVKPAHPNSMPASDEDPEHTNGKKCDAFRGSSKCSDIMHLELRTCTGRRQTRNARFSRTQDRTTLSVRSDQPTDSAPIRNHQEPRVQKNDEFKEVFHSHLCMVPRKECKKWSTTTKSCGNTWSLSLSRSLSLALSLSSLRLSLLSLSLSPPVA